VLDVMGENDDMKPAWYGVMVPLVCPEDWPFESELVDEPDEFLCLGFEPVPSRGGDVWLGG
jgi:hypothetical protein